MKPALTVIAAVLMVLIARVDALSAEKGQQSVHKQANEGILIARTFGSTFDRFNELGDIVKPALCAPDSVPEQPLGGKAPLIADHHMHLSGIEFWKTILDEHSHDARIVDVNVSPHSSSASASSGITRQLSGSTSAQVNTRVHPEIESILPVSQKKHVLKYIVEPSDFKATVHRLTGQQHKPILQPTSLSPRPYHNSGVAWKPQEKAELVRVFHPELARSFNLSNQKEWKRLYLRFYSRLRSRLARKRLAQKIAEQPISSGLRERLTELMESTSIRKPSTSMQP